MTVQVSAPDHASLDSESLRAYIEGFFGYGNLKAPLWFVGMEEGGGSNADEIRRRLDAWQRSGRPVLDDLAGFHRACGLGYLFDKGAKTQRTWKELIRVALMVEGRITDKASIGAHQVDGFGRRDGPVALLELLPLPKVSVASWPYANWTCAKVLPYLQKPWMYRKHVLQDRINEIRRLADLHRPRAVLFYSKTYQRHWESIAGRPFDPGPYPMVAQKDGTTYMLLPHPVARSGSQTPHYIRAAEMLRDLFGSAG